MRRYNFIRLFAICHLLLAICLWGCAKREITNIDSQGKTIICFGDSITFGYGVNPGEDYPTALAKMVNLPVINAGIDGDTTNEALKRIATDVFKKEPLLVIVEFGGNDFLEKIPLEQTVNNVEEIIKAIQSKGAIVAIADISTSIIMANYSRKFKRLSRKYNAIFIPHLMAGILTNPSLKSDYIHPNAEGYNLIAQRVYRTISIYLEQNAILKGIKK